MLPTKMYTSLNLHSNILFIIVLSQTEIDKYIRISISDLLPTNLNDYSIEFDELGILKQVNKVILKLYILHVIITCIMKIF